MASLVEDVLMIDLSNVVIWVKLEADVVVLRVGIVTGEDPVMATWGLMVVKEKRSGKETVNQIFCMLHTHN